LTSCSPHKNIEVTEELPRHAKLGEQVRLVEGGRQAVVEHVRHDLLAKFGGQLLDERELVADKVGVVFACPRRFLLGLLEV
jgi:hypothetical protein